MKQIIDTLTFDAKFKRDITALTKAENKSADLIKPMSRDVLEAVHVTGNVDYLNRFVDALRTANKRIAVLYFKEFSGFKHDEKEGKFTSKDKARYEEKKAKAIAFLEDVNNNMLSWQSRHVTIEKAPVTLDTFKKQFNNSMTKALQSGITRQEVLATVLNAGFTTDEVLAVLEVVANEQAPM